MNRDSRLAMKLQQTLSFSRLLLHTDRAPAIFWPGCALMSLEPQLLYRTHEVLKRLEPQLGFCSACCGQPSRYLFPRKFARQQKLLLRELKAKGVERIYTACPNCETELSRLGPFQVEAIWPALVKVLHKSDVVERTGQILALHDPCPQRNRQDIQEATRELIRLTGAQVYEVARSRDKTLCCGNKGMKKTLDPQLAARIRHERLKDFPPELPITACCQGCLGSFAAEGRCTLHLLEVLFGSSSSPSWGNRLKFSRDIKSHKK